MTHVELFTFNPFSENTYVVYDKQSREAVIIDPGCWEAAERQSLMQYIQEQRLQVKAVWNTHCHLDHVFGNRWATDTFEVGLWAHAQEQFNLDNMAMVCTYFGIPPFDPGSIDHPLKEGMQLVVGNAVFEVLFTPGHSPGHVVFYNAAEGYCINGDVLFRMSIGRTDLPGGDHLTLLRSIREKLFVLPDDTLIYTGHGEPTTIGFEKQHNPFLNGMYS
ncbi:glyoxylase-like metal-dependent hydrolase (beta-lactamase superfamily II) [Thermonema lapsum]|uniref:Glyoxylase-like metal-dependent hydrolase (Beta-lactamase superfamily II) n=1 Tax=Thermonema lapsum TaxID=28195 RepID=A0A846MP19_9BACT|nr:MBL fold metallo-hydrolase [Thermonema lapsum]NIK73205.1 glyoxylase-like metal-dependent hydrolase (beta-lactamase superfamily II) [Thermonema lapsum]